MIENVMGGMDDSAAAGALVVNGKNPMLGADFAFDRQRTEQGKALLAMQDTSPGDPGLRLLVPEGRPAQSHALAGDRERPAAFVDIGQFVLVDRVLAHAEAERIERAVANIVAVDD